MNKISKQDWDSITLAEDDTHHLWNNQPFYAKRFHHVLKYHACGLAPVSDESGAYHITLEGNPFYAERYLQAFGFYCHRAAVESIDGWYHIDENGKSAYSERFAWCGNFQEGYCTVKDMFGHYFHINQTGKRIYEENYCYAGDYRESYAVVCNTQGLHTHINHRGELMHGKWFLGLDVFHKSIARAKDNKGWFHIDKKGAALYSERYQIIEPFYNKIAHVETFDGSLLTIDVNGKILTVIKQPSNYHLLHELSADLVGFWKTQTIAASVKLKIMDYLPGDIYSVSQSAGLSDQFCKRLLRGLQELGIIKNQQGYFTLTNKGKLLQPTAQSPMAAAALVWADEHYQTWPQLTSRLKQSSSSKNYFNTLAQSSEALYLYHHALSLYAIQDYQTVIHKIDWRQHQCVIDVGGGTGALLHLLLDQYTHLEGTVLDMPEVIDLIEDKEKRQRAKYIGTDFFKPWPHQADAIIFGRILHDWSDEFAITLLRIAKSHLTPTGKIYILEMILPEETGNGGLLDLNMLVMTGGQERYAEEWKKLAKNADLHINTHHEDTSIVSLLVMESLT